MLKAMLERFRIRHAELIAVADKKIALLQDSIRKMKAP